jgi:hypothetical protein
MAKKIKHEKWLMVRLDAMGASSDDADEFRLNFGDTQLITEIGMGPYLVYLVVCHRNY